MLKVKSESQVEKAGKCNIDRISDIVPNRRVVFRDLLGRYSYRTHVK